VLALAGMVAAAGCKDDHVRLGYRPAVGSSATYRVRVDSHVARVVADQPVQRTSEETVVETTHRVLSASGSGVRVRVVIGQPGAPRRTFVVRFDRAAQLQAVEQVEGVPTSSLGQLGLSEIFPAAAGAPPSRPLSPGDRWDIHERVRLPGDTAARLVTGEGRLASLGHTAGRDVATVTSRLHIPVVASTDVNGSRVELRGTQVTTARSTYDLADGVLWSSAATTTGTLRLVLHPPSGVGGTPVEGTLTYDITSRTTRRV
jgi:hypothetical protein